MSRTRSSVVPPLRWLSIVEAVTYLVLVTSAITKRAGGSELGVTVMGPVHGVLFLVYAGFLLRDREVLGWELWRTITAMVIGSLPFGGFWIERRWLAPLSSV